YKTNNPINTSYNNKLMKSVFEHLSNEIIFEVFEYLDLYHVYYGFFSLNKRFKYLLVDSNILIKINTLAISKSKFEHYYQNIINPNKNRINILRLSNQFTVDIVFSPPHIISEFIQLEKLILDNINMNNLYEIFQELMSLFNLRSLTLNIAEYVDSSIDIFSKLFLLPKLKYCYIKYQIKSDYSPLSNYLNISSIEHLIINARFPYNELYKLMDCIPKIRYLSINYIIRSSPNNYNESYPVQLSKNFKKVSFSLDLIQLDQFEKIIKNFFGNVEVLTISTNYDEAYLDANRWEHMISCYMPHLRIFDIKHDGCASKSTST
ncbi:unnamed protein product, partial [Rotaria sp. Silwood2]